MQENPFQSNILKLRWRGPFLWHAERNFIGGICQLHSDKLEKNTEIIENDQKIVALKMA